MTRMTKSLILSHVSEGLQTHNCVNLITHFNPHERRQLCDRPTDDVVKFVGSWRTVMVIVAAREDPPYDPVFRL